MSGSRALDANTRPGTRISPCCSIRHRNGVSWTSSSCATSAMITAWPCCGLADLLSNPSAVCYPHSEKIQHLQAGAGEAQVLTEVVDERAHLDLVLRGRTVDGHPYRERRTGFGKAHRSAHPASRRVVRLLRAR